MLNLLGVTEFSDEPVVLFDKIVPLTGTRYNISPWDNPRPATVLLPVDTISSLLFLCL